MLNKTSWIKVASLCAVLCLIAGVLHGIGAVPGTEIIFPVLFLALVLVIWGIYLRMTKGTSGTLKAGIVLLVISCLVLLLWIKFSPTNSAIRGAIWERNHKL